MIVKDGTIMKDIFKYRECYQNIVRHFKVLFYDLIMEDEVLEKAEMFQKLNIERKGKFLDIENKNYKILKEMYISKKNISRKKKV